MAHKIPLARKEKKFIAIVLVFIFTIAWHIRAIPVLDAGYLPNAYGVHSEWTRLHIIRNHQLAVDYTPLTDISLRAGVGNREFGLIYISILSVVIGQIGVGSIRFLHLIPFVGLVLLPTVFVAFDRKIPGQNHPVIMLLLGLFATKGVVTVTSTAGNYSTYSLYLLILLLMLLPDYKNKKVELLCLLLIFTILNSYHTVVFMSIFFIGVYFLGQIAKSVNIGSLQHYALGATSKYVVFLSLVSAMFFFTGTQFNDHFYEFTTHMSQALVADSWEPGLASTRNELLVDTITSSDSLLITIRQISKVLYRLCYFGILSVFAHSIVTDGWGENVEMKKYGYFLFTMLASFPIVFSVYFSYGGIATAVIRTEGIGFVFAIFAAAFILSKASDRRRIVVTILSIIIVVSVIPAAGLSYGNLNDTHSSNEVRAIETVAQSVPDDGYVFSDARLGNPLMLYGQNGISILRFVYPGTNQLFKNIYRSSSCSVAMDSVNKVITMSQTKYKGADSKYIFVSKRYGTAGVSIEAATLEIGQNKFYRKFNRANKMYASGETMLFSGKGCTSN